ncbi:hypothetical protein Xvie_03867 [Xenorhabdus vietnamensis]|uniref:Uncharacterized protein n=1 Tax=Xenorhabdus vietnamensis TaxID=351656 RepID=A0A1Y2S6H8_9GAMM|nr:hypothetical protein [Xenorhabdus vietnamensis]OTA14256.1 hypothetical protein Xvie_03867 [Xenorhabdus vietnamensis]UVN17734.1 hypothetical protein pXVIEV2_040 [Xenorhabdus vietnamensis]
MSVWDEFHKLSTLSVGFLDNTSAKNAEIFANGKNQVAIYIKVKVLKQDGSESIISPEELLKQTYLVNYVTGEKINYNGTWNYSPDNLGYSNIISWNSSYLPYEMQVRGGERLVVYYISTQNMSSGIDIGAEIDIPGVGQFNTTQDGTRTINAPAKSKGSVFKSPSFVRVSARNSIDYSLSENIMISNMPKSISDFETVVSDMLVTHTNWANVAYDNYEGTSLRTEFYIKPKYGILFHEMNVRRNQATLSTVRIVGDGYADTVWGVGGEYYDTQFIFVNKETYGLDSDSSILAKCGWEDYCYKIGDSDGRHCWRQTLPEGMIKVNICNHRIPRSQSEQKGWSNDGTTIRIDVVDNYGNSGVITITASDSRWPQLVVNGI